MSLGVKNEQKGTDSKEMNAEESVGFIANENRRWI